MLFMCDFVAFRTSSQDYYSYHRFVHAISKDTDVRVTSYEAAC